MTEQRLTTLLKELAADAEVDLDTAVETWRIAGERRRSRRLTTGAVATAATVAVVAVGVVHASGTSGPPDHTGHGGTPVASATSTPTGEGRAQLAPARSAEPGLSFLVSALPRSIDTSKTAVAALPPLADAPVQRAVALAESTGDYETPAPIVVIGADGEARRMDGISLRWVTDSGGNRSLPLDNGSLSPDGTRAAFAQKDTLVVVDLRTGTGKRWPLVGSNESVAWSPRSDEVQVSGGLGVWLVDPTDGAVTPMPELAPSAARIPLGGHQWHDVTSGSVSYVDAWWRQAFASEGRVAIGAFSTGLLVEGAVTADPQVLAVVELADPSNEQLLAFDWTGRYKGCCAALGWLDKDTVLFSSEGGNDPVRILAWNLQTKAVSRVSELTNSSVISVALQ